MRKCRTINTSSLTDEYPDLQRGSKELRRHGGKSKSGSGSGSKTWDTGKEEDGRKDGTMKGGGDHSEQREAVRDTIADTPYFLTHKICHATSVAVPHFDPFDDYDENEYDYYSDDYGYDDGYDRRPCAASTITQKGASECGEYFVSRDRDTPRAHFRNAKPLMSTLVMKSGFRGTRQEEGFDSTWSPSARVVRATSNPSDVFTLNNSDDIRFRFRANVIAMTVKVLLWMLTLVLVLTTVLMLALVVVTVANVGIADYDVSSDGDNEKNCSIPELCCSFRPFLILCSSAMHKSERME